MKVMIGTGKTVHAGIELKHKTVWGEKVKAICGIKGNTGGIIRSGCFRVDDSLEITCKKCITLIAKTK